MTGTAAVEANVTADSATLSARAAYVLRGNDLGTLTAAAPRLYPHLWSWDAAFVATGLATVSVSRAVLELHTLLEGQWRTGMIPHILFGPAGGYFPDAQFWNSALADGAPGNVRTSGICQPPVHAIALRKILDAGRRRGGPDRELAEEFVAGTFDRWLAWHRWLAEARDPQHTGLIEIFHGWESGMDNSPRWDRPYARIVPPDDLLAGPRRDLLLVPDATERPTDQEYRRYLWLVQQMKQVRYDTVALRDSVDFRVRDVFMTAIAAEANELLAEIGDEFGRRDEAGELRAYAARFRAGVRRTVSPDSGLARDQDVRSGEYLEARTIGGFAPLICGADEELVRSQVRLLTGPQWCGHPGLRFQVPPTTAPDTPGFASRTYWRGPQWPATNWLIYWALRRRGADEAAAHIRSEALRQLSDLAFGEYYEPFTGEALGSTDQSWSAAVALDWLLAPS